MAQQKKPFQTSAPSRGTMWCLQTMVHLAASSKINWPSKELSMRSMNKEVPHRLLQTTLGWQCRDMVPARIYSAFLRKRQRLLADQLAAVFVVPSFLALFVQSWTMVYFGIFRQKKCLIIQGNALQFTLSKPSDSSLNAPLGALSQVCNVFNVWSFESYIHYSGFYYIISLGSTTVCYTIFEHEG